jgi:predicted MFS family arabinose efflux permease
MPLLRRSPGEREWQQTMNVSHNWEDAMDEPHGESRAYSNYVLFVLALGMMLSYADRQLMSVLMSPIKAELHLSDSQLGFLSGLAFALFYAVCAIPLARLADRSSRRNILTVVLSLWSVVTMMGGIAQSFLHLLLIRIGVGVGEAGYTPAAYSALADYFPPERRQFASGLMNAFPQIGVVASLLIGGLIAPVYGWRVAFFVAGAPGLFVAALIFFTVREPRRGTPVDAAHAGAAPLRSSLAVLWRIRSYRYVVLTAALQAFSTFSLTVWMPSFLERSHDMSLSVIGPALAAATLCGAVGSVLGGALGDRVAKRDARYPLYMAAISFLVCIPLMMGTLHLPSVVPALVCYAIFFLGLTLSHGPAFAICLNTTPDEVRALGVSVLMFTVAFVGFGLGPLATGIASDMFASAGFPDPLRAAMTLMTFSLLLPALAAVAAAKYLPTDIGAPPPRQSRADQSSQADAAE